MHDLTEIDTGLILQAVIDQNKSIGGIAALDFGQLGNRLFTLGHEMVVETIVSQDGSQGFLGMIVGLQNQRLGAAPGVRS